MGLAWILLAGLLLLAGCGDPRGEGHAAPGVLVIAIDGLRADHVHHLGHDRDTTPNLDRIAAEGISFAQAFSSAPELLPSHVALLTGCDPVVARRFMPNDFAAPPERRWRIPDAVPRVAVQFLAHGYATAAFVDHPDLARIYGFAAGFQEYENSEGDERPDAPLGRPLVQWLDGLDRDQPWFAYVDTYELERAWSRPLAECDQYFDRRPGMDEIPPVASTDSSFFAIPRSRWRGASRTLGHYDAIYDGRLHCLDRRIGDLLDQIEVAGRRADTTVVIVGTYGVQFGEAGLYLTAGCYSMADLRVPLIVRPSRSLAVAAGRTGEISSRLVSLVDLAPSLLQLSGLPVPAGTHGISFADELLGPVAAPARGPRHYAIASCGLQEGCAVIGERYCLEYLLPERVADKALERSWFGRYEDEPGPRVRFYDRIATPFPPLDLPVPSDSRPEFFEFRARAARWIENISQARRILQATPAQLREIDPDPALVTELRRLGYLGDVP